MTLWAFNRPFKILGCDPQTQQYYMNKYGKKFPLGGFDDNYQKERPGMFFLNFFSSDYSAL